MGALMRRGLERLEDAPAGHPDGPPSRGAGRGVLPGLRGLRAHPPGRAHPAADDHRGHRPGGPRRLTPRGVREPRVRAHRGRHGRRRRESGGAGPRGRRPGHSASTEWTASCRRRERRGGRAKAAGAPDVGDVFAMLHAVWALAQGMAEYDRLYTGPEREVLRSRHRESSGPTSRVRSSSGRPGRPRRRRPAERTEPGLAPRASRAPRAALPPARAAQVAVVPVPQRPRGTGAHAGRLEAGPHARAAQVALAHAPVGAVPRHAEGARQRAHAAADAQRSLHDHGVRARGPASARRWGTPRRRAPRHSAGRPARRSSAGRPARLRPPPRTPGATRPCRRAARGRSGRSRRPRRRSSPSSARRRGRTPGSSAGLLVHDLRHPADGRPCTPGSPETGSRSPASSSRVDVRLRVVVVQVHHAGLRQLRDVGAHAH